MPQWAPLFRTSTPGSSQIDWSKPLALTSCDPYLVWRDHTGTDPVKAGPGTSELVVKLINKIDMVTVLVELVYASGQLLEPEGNLNMSPTYPFGTAGPSKVRSYLIPRSNLQRLALAVQRGKVLRFELSHTRTREFNTLLALIVGYINKDKDTTDLLRSLGLERLFIDLLPWLNLVFPALTGLTNQPFPTLPGLTTLSLGLAPTATTAAPSPSPSRGSGTVVAIIDDLCPFASPRLRRPDGSFSVQSLWDQGLDPLELISRESQGADLTGQFQLTKPGDEASPNDGSQFNSILEMFMPQVGRGNDPENDQNFLEPDIYRRTGYLKSMRRWGHGTVVTHLIAGGSGSAPEHDMIWVQLPDSTVVDTSGGSLASHALDGIHHALKRAAGRQLVVNLSYGTHAGPHDGTSLFETGLQELLTKNPCLHVVLPAGNSHLLRTHSSPRVPGRSTITMRWKVMPDDSTDSYMEIWFPPGAEFEVSVCPPWGESGTVRPDSGRVWIAEDGVTTRAAVIYPKAVAQGRKGTMCLVALAPTRRSVGSAQPGETARGPLEAPHGIWEIKLCNLKEDTALVHAWIQRDDTAPGRGPRSRGQMGRQSYFVDTEQDFVDPCFTLNGIATLPWHPRLRVVGAMRASDRGVSLYSSAGPSRDEPSRTGGPDVVAVADHSANLPGLLAGGMLAASRLRVGGTSIAAAVVSGMWCRHLAAGGTAESFYFFPVQHEAEQPRRSDEAPTRAVDWIRGSWERIEPYEAGQDSAIRGPGSAAF